MVVETVQAHVVIEEVGVTDDNVEDMSRETEISSKYDRSTENFLQVPLIRFFARLKSNSEFGEKLKYLKKKYVRSQDP